jgi:hypothetical protein
VTDVVIYNLNGQQMRSVRNSDVIDIGHMPHGLYFVKDREGNVAKLVVK